MSENNSDSPFTSKSDAGKGDRPRNISKRFVENYEQINWKSKTQSEILDNKEKKQYK
jgi:hypothetical protein